MVSVGGTTLSVTGLGSSWTFQGETDWSGGGGGCSAYEAANRAQSGFGTYPQAGCDGYRATPDLALDATVGIAVNLNGGLYGSGSGTTGSKGTITFQIKNAPRGTYVTTVTTVSAPGYTWSPTTTPTNSYTKGP